MNSKELIKKTFRCEETETTPWVPFSGCHGGFLLNISADKYLKSADHIVKGQLLAAKQYRADGIPVMFDLQIEAEAMGCSLKWSKENPPAVIEHLLENNENDLKKLCLPKITDARYPILIETTKRLRQNLSDKALYGLITGPFTLALHLLGTSTFMKMLEDPDYVHKLMDFCKDLAIFTADLYIDNGCDVIASVDPMTSQIDPSLFDAFVKKPTTELFDHIKKRDTLTSFFVCGMAQQNIEVMSECMPHNISIDENIPLDYVKNICLSKNISFGGNLQLTSVLLLGSENDSRINALECIETSGNKGFVLAPGCDLPYATPPKNLETVSILAKDKYQQDVTREIAKNMIKTETKQKLPNEYKNPKKVIIDVITLDSSSCAPCQYMLEAVKTATQNFNDKVLLREFSIKSKDGLERMQMLNVKNIPTTCINGKPAFISQIPAQKEIVETFKNSINET